MTLWRLGAILLAAGAISAQSRVDLRNTHERLICVVPMTGSGTAADPREPMYVRTPGIVAFAAQVSDDGKFALVEFVAHDRAAFKQILDEQRADVKVFHKGKSQRGEIERELRKFKKNFELDSFGVALP